MPATGAVTAVAPVQTSIRTPASKGEKPITSCANWVSRKIDPNVPKYMKNETPFVTANVRLGNRASGGIGSGARRSQATNAASTASPPASDATISGLVQ